MKRISIILFLVVLGAVALSACGPTTINQAAPPPQRTLNVNGTGIVYLAPDVAYINIGVRTEQPTAAEAVSENNAQTQQVIDAVKNAGVEAKDIRTTNFSIYPSVQYDPQTGAKLATTYVVDNTVYVTVRKLDQLGSLLDMTVSAGANTINSIQFDVADKSAAIKQARDQAVKDAQSQAKEIAATAGITLGDLQTISFYDSIPSPVVDAYGKGGAVALEAAVPVNPGQLTLTVTVNITYEIK